MSRCSPVVGDTKSACKQSNRLCLFRLLNKKIPTSAKEGQGNKNREGERNGGERKTSEVAKKDKRIILKKR